jgi:hypothetical protein
MYSFEVRGTTIDSDGEDATRHEKLVRGLVAAMGLF